MVQSRNEEIIEAIKTGENGKVLQHLYRNDLPKIVRFIKQNNGDEDEAKDIFQDAVIALFQTVKLGKFENGKDIGAFLYFVARNLWINRVKRRNRQFSIKDTELLSQQETPLAFLLSAEKQEAIAGVMDKIGAQCKQLLRYTMYDKLSMKEVALKMNFAGESVAKSSHYRCKQKLVALISGNKNLEALFRG